MDKWLIRGEVSVQCYLLGPKHFTKGGSYQQSILISAEDKVVDWENLVKKISPWVLESWSWKTYSDRLDPKKVSNFLGFQWLSGFGHRCNCSPAILTFPKAFERRCEQWGWNSWHILTMNCPGICPGWEICCKIATYSFLDPPFPTHVTRFFVWAHTTRIPGFRYPVADGMFTSVGSVWPPNSKMVAQYISNTWSTSPWHPSAS